jgi:hypothetical protein
VEHEFAEEHLSFHMFGLGLGVLFVVRFEVVVVFSSRRLGE